MKFHHAISPLKHTKEKIEKAKCRWHELARLICRLSKSPVDIGDYCVGKAIRIRLEMLFESIFMLNNIMKLLGERYARDKKNCT